MPIVVPSISVSSSSAGQDASRSPEAGASAPRRHHSLSRNVAVAAFAAIAAVAVMCAIAFALAAYTALDSRAADDLTYETNRYAQVIDERGLSGDTLVAFLDEQAGVVAPDTRITLIDADGVVLFDSVVDDVGALDNHGLRPEVEQAEQAGEGSVGRYSATLQEVTLYHSVRLGNGDVLRFATTQSSVWGLMADMALPSAAVLVLALASAVLISRFIGRRIASDLSRIDLDDPLSADAPEEISPLLERLDAQHRRLEAQADERRMYTANVTHELKTPLTVISGYAEIIAKGIARPADIQTFSQFIHDEAQRMKTMVDEIISLSRLDGMGSGAGVDDARDAGVNMNEQVSLETVAREVWERLRPYAAELGVDLVTESRRVDNEPITVRGNERIIEELVRNLAENAVRYNVKGGRATIEAIGRPDGGAAVRVSDTGIGIPAHLRERVFERFFRVDESRSKETGGSGLGLAIVKHAASVHGASVSIEDNVPKGTVITVEFPA